jgi:hypothetical protein
MGPQGLETAEFTVFRGRVTEAQFTDGECAIEVVDKFHQLYESIFGSDDQPIRLTAYFPSSLAFNLIGSAGLSSVPSSHNPDIDYESFTSWDTTFRDAITRMSTNYTGQRPTEILKEISQLTNSAIYIDHGVENSKIKFGKLSIADDSKINFVNDEDLISAKVRVSLDDVVNRQVIFADYSVNSNFHRVTVNDRSLASYSLYGKHEQIEKSNLVWFVNSTSAISAAQEIVLQSKDPPLYVDAKLPLTGLKYSISEKINIADSITNVADNFHIIGKKVDLDAGTVTITGRQTRVQSIFTLDFSKLDGSDILN